MPISILKSLLNRFSTILLYWSDWGELLPSMSIVPFQEEQVFFCLTMSNFLLSKEWELSMEQCWPEPLRSNVLFLGSRWARQGPYSSSLSQDDVNGPLEGQVLFRKNSGARICSCCWEIWSILYVMMSAKLFIALGCLLSLTSYTLTHVTLLCQNTNQHCLSVKWHLGVYIHLSKICFLWALIGIRVLL